jgi:hypothetical protein
VPSPSEPSVPTPIEPTFPDPTEPNPPSTPDVPGGSAETPTPSFRGADARTGGRHAASGAEDERFVHGEGQSGDLSVLAQDAAHPFDQTNGILDQLEGDADDPDRVESRVGSKGILGRAFEEQRGDDFGRDEELTEDEEP